MKRLLILLLFILGSSAIASARDSVKGWCEEGNQSVKVSGLNSTTRVQASHPSCTITVYIHGGGLATIYADNNGTPLANPFTAQSGGRWQAYANDGRYDVTMSSAGFTQTVTYSDIILCDPFVAGAICSGGGGGGGGATPHNLLSATHLDTVPFSPPVRGDIITSQAAASPSGVNPSWGRLPLGPVNYVLTSNGLDAVWSPATGGGGGGSVSNLRVCEIIIGADNLVGNLVDPDIAPQGRQCFVPQNATLIEIDVASDTGTPSVVTDKITPAGSRTSLTSSPLATAASGGVACANAGGGLGLDGVTTCSAILQNTALPAGYYVETNTATASGAKRMSISLIWLVTSSSGVITLQTNGVANGSQSLLNLIGGNNITITDNGFGGITIAGSSKHGLSFSIGDPLASSTLSAGSTTTSYLSVPFACTINRYTLMVDTGTITVKFWKVALGTAIPTSSNSINTSGVSISSGTAITSTILSDFTTTAVSANDAIAMNVTAATGPHFVNGVLSCQE